MSYELRALPCVLCTFGTLTKLESWGRRLCWDLEHAGYGYTYLSVRTNIRVDDVPEGLVDKWDR